MDEELKDKINNAIKNINIPDKNLIWEKLSHQLDEKGKNQFYKRINKKLFVFLIAIFFGVSVCFYFINKLTDLKSKVLAEAPSQMLRHKVKISTSEVKKSQKLLESNGISTNIQVIKDDIGDNYYSVKMRELNKITSKLSKFKINTKRINLKYPDWESRLVKSENLTHNKKFEDQFIRNTAIINFNFKKLDSLSMIDKDDSIKTVNIVKDTLPKRYNKRFLSYNLSMGLSWNNFSLINKYSAIKSLNLGFGIAYIIKGSFYLKSDILLTKESMSIDFIDYQEGRYKIDRIHQSSNLLLGTLYGYKYKSLSIESGIYLGYTLKMYGITSYYSDLKYSKDPKIIEEKGFISSGTLDNQLLKSSYFKKHDYGLLLGFNKRFNKILIGLRYSQGLRDYIKLENFSTEQNKYNPHRNIFLNVGYTF